MKFIINLSLVALFLFSSAAIFAQNNGAFDVRFNMASFDCTGGYYFVDVEVRAKDAASEFNMSDQNYRFSFNKSAIKAYDLSLPIADRSVQIVQEFITGFVQVDGTGSFYDPHTLTGSIDSVSSYNVVLAGGDGYPVKELVWTKVGRLSFEILDGNLCPDLIWHDSAPENFPPTFIGEKSAGTLFAAAENIYTDFENCAGPICGPLPIELKEFKGTENECTIDLTWTTLTESNNDHFILERSYNGDDYDQIAMIDGQGTTTDAHTYNFTDRNIGVLNYYRLSQVDTDGTAETFNVIQVKSTCFAEVRGISELYPNPVGTNEVVNIKLVNDTFTADARLVVTSVDGKIIEERTITLTEGPNLLQYDAAKLSSGTYFMQIKDSDWFSTPKKFVKVD